MHNNICWSLNGWTLGIHAFTHADFDAWVELVGKDRNTVLRALMTAMKAGAKTLYIPNGNRPASYDVDGFYWEVEA